MPVALSNAWAVLLLFLIPMGGGIPAGVLEAKNRSMGWPEMMVLYLISDVILALLFEPVMWLVIAIGKRSQMVARITEALRKAFRSSMQRSTSHYGHSLGPFSLVMVSFGVDPMTGRAATVTAGHGFISGWALAITGDMIYFTVLMVSTLWLNNILGDGAKTDMIILAGMIIIPAIVRRLRGKKSGQLPGNKAGRAK